MKHQSKYKPLKKGFVKRLTLYGHLSKCLDTGKVEDYDEFLNYLEAEKNPEELKDLLTHMMRDYLTDKFDYKLFTTKKKEAV